MSEITVKERAASGYVERVREFMNALPADLPGAVEMFGAEDIVWTLPPTVPGGGRPWVGKANVIKFLSRMQAGF